MQEVSTSDTSDTVALGTGLEWAAAAQEETGLRKEEVLLLFLRLDICVLHCL